MTNFRVIAMLAVAASLTISVLAASDVQVRLSTPRREYSRIEAVVLTITIQNSTDHAVTFSTMERDPPVSLLVLDERGRNRIIDGPNTYIKDRTTRNRVFSLRPREVLTYEKPLEALLGRDQHLGQFGPGNLRIEVSIPRVTYENGVYKVELIKSNESNVVLMN